MKLHMTLAKRWSFTELGHGSNDCRECVLGVGERRVVSGSPSELGAESGVDSIFNVVLRRHVSDFLIHGGESLDSWHQVEHFQHWHFIYVADVPHCLELLQVAGIVSQVQHEVISVGHFQFLDCLGLVTDLGHSWLNVVFCLHESFVFVLDLSDDASSVDVWFPIGPVNLLEASVVGGLGEEFEDGGDLSEFVSAVHVVGSHPQSVQPLVGQVSVYSKSTIITLLCWL